MKQKELQKPPLPRLRTSLQHLVGGSFPSSLDPTVKPRGIVFAWADRGGGWLFASQAAQLALAAAIS